MGWLGLAVLVPLVIGFVLGAGRGVLACCGLWTITLLATAVIEDNPAGDFYTVGAVLGYPYFALLAVLGSGVRRAVSRPR